MKINKSIILTALFTVAYIIVFGIMMIAKKNYEFLIYLAVVIFFFLLIILNLKKIELSNNVIWGLSIWGLLHLAGGNIFINGTRLYDLTIYLIRMDQLIHMYGFCVATITSYQLLKPFLKKNIKKWLLLSFLVIMIGMGFGALNEVVELAAVLLLKAQGVGDYLNNAFDLVFNLIGAIIAVAIIHIRGK